jgi:glucosamine--fructose-6-phosphate aminotransferase (isomerizing)
MGTKGQHTLAEITTQPEAWADALQAFEARQDELKRSWTCLRLQRVLFAGCGSTHYLSQTAAFLFQSLTGVPARACPSSEIVLFGPQVMPDPGRTLLVAISRSGTTTETLIAVERFRRLGGQAVWTITCYPNSPLAQAADLVLPAQAAQEQSVAQTRSFTSMLLLAQALTAALAGNAAMLERLRRLPEALNNLSGRLGDLPRQLGTNLDIERIYFLGGGPLYGVANEAMLKTKEMSLSHAEAYHPLEFRHGPMSMVNEHTLVVGLLSDSGLAEELRVLAEMQQLGARVLALAEDGSALTPRRPETVVELQSSLKEGERGLLYLPVLQRLAYHRALAKGLDPDRPNNLTAVVTL